MRADQTSSLPEPDATSVAHSKRVAEYIREHIDDSGGSISFAEYMHHALYAPGLGYYTAGSTKFGEAGDFVTAPEISTVFGRVLARQCAEVLGQMQNGIVLEYGAGSGKLAVDMLHALAERDALPESYMVLEVSPDLCERQEAYVNAHAPEFAHLVSWLDMPPERMNGVIVANEVLDSFPVERFVRRNGGVMQLRVTPSTNGFDWAEAPAPVRLLEKVERIETDIGQRLPDGHVSEVCLAVSPWIGGMASVLKGGVAFLLDYGISRREYYAPDRGAGWLRCYFRHHAHDDPLILPGVQDLTAWVDFTDVATIASHAGFDIAGYTPQAQFLMAGGLEDEMRGFDALPLDEQLKLSGQVKKLTLPGEMGEHFKCLALSKGTVEAPSAFDLADRTHTL